MPVKNIKAIVSAIEICVAAAPLTSCLVPEAAPILGQDIKKRVFYDVVRGVQCEIRHAVQRELRDDRSSVWGKRKLAWLEDWMATMDLNLKIDDRIAFNPGVLLKTSNWTDAQVWRADGSSVLFPQGYNLGIGAGLAYGTSRYDKVQFEYDFRTFVGDHSEDPDRPCYRIAGYSVEGDLKLYDWLDDVLEPVRKCAFEGTPFEPETDKTQGPLEMLNGPPEISQRCAAADLTRAYKGKNSPIKGFHHDITFLLKFDANITPSWNLVRVSASGSPLLDASRADFSELLISLGPADSAQVSLAHQALQIGSAVRH